MGNQNSQPSNDFQKQFQYMQEQLKNQYRKQTVDLHKLQQQIYYTQMKMNDMKNNQNQQQYPSQQYPSQQQSSNSLNNLLSNPELKQEMSNNPAFGVQIIELILKEYGTKLSELQYEKINNYLERANQQTSQQQIQQVQQVQVQKQIHHQQHQQHQHVHVQKQIHQQQYRSDSVVHHPTQNMSMKDRYETEEEEALRKFEEE
jgi:uncharacterized protein YneF (UPF0154 family)